MVVSMKNYVEKRKQLEQAYILSMVDKQANLQQHYDRLKAGSSDIEDLNADLHKLSGSAGMYGFEEISQSAQKLMHSLKNDVQGDISNNEEVSETFTELLTIMKNIK